MLCFFGKLRHSVVFTLSYFVIKYSHYWICGGRRYQLISGIYSYSSFNISCIYLAKAFVFFSIYASNWNAICKQHCQYLKPCVCHHSQLFWDIYLACWLVIFAASLTNSTQDRTIQYLAPIHWKNYVTEWPSFLKTLIFKSIIIFEIAKQFSVHCYISCIPMYSTLAPLGHVMFKSYGNRFAGTETTVQINNFNDTFTSNATFSKNNNSSNFISWILRYVFKQDYIVRLAFLSLQQ